MNIETANRLAELRKKNGLSQEELADKLGLSRQAVSKWERAESSPDTDNLILLARLYNVSLDELLKSDKPVDEIIKDNKDNMNESGSSAKEDAGKKDSISVGSDGIHIESRDGSVSVEADEIRINGKEYTQNVKKSKRGKVVGLLHGIFFTLAAGTYIFLGLFWKAYCPTTGAYNAGWAVGWIVFLLAPIIPSIVDAIWSRRANKVNFFLMGLSAYLYLGMMLPDAKGWHPWWCLVVAAVVLHTVIGTIENTVKGEEKEEDEDDDEDDDKVVDSEVCENEKDE